MFSPKASDISPKASDVSKKAFDMKRQVLGMRLLALAMLLFCGSSVVEAQLSTAKKLVSMAIPNSGLEEIHGEVVELCKVVRSDVEALNIMSKGCPLLEDSVVVLTKRAAACGITLDVQLGTMPSLPDTAVVKTQFSEDEYQKLSKIKKTSYLFKTHKALRAEHEDYSVTIDRADTKLKEIFGFLDETSVNIRQQELRTGRTNPVVEWMDAADRQAIELLRNNVDEGKVRQ